MYDWLTDALRDSGQVITASQRLARELAAEFGKQQVAAGQSAWRSPAIHSWHGWLLQLLTTAEPEEPLPARINAYQSRVLWERCIRREISDPLINLSLLVQQSRDSWARLQEFEVPLAKCEQAAHGKDQRIFARAAINYQSILDRERWVDDAGLAGLVSALIKSRRIPLPTTLTLTGFDRYVPQVAAVLDGLRAADTVVAVSPQLTGTHKGDLYAYENDESEFRAAGAWARRELLESPNQSIAIVATGLELEAQKYARLVREGLAPGWQTAVPAHGAAVNVSYGQRLSEYPAIAVALQVLGWLHNDLASVDVATLLRSAVIGKSAIAGRARLELALRQLPDRSWSPAMILRALGNCDDSNESCDWLDRVATVDQLRSEMPVRETPSQWAVAIDRALKAMNWPGDDALDSVTFQVVNRWRELLNDLARLELVTPTMTLAETVGRLQSIATETIFQPEVDGSIVNLLGPLEAAGMRFDKLWIAGLSAAKWPPLGRPSSLVSRTLQRDYGMPDAEPQDTLDYASRVLRRLAASANQFKCSYPMTDGDIEQSESGLLSNIAALSAKPPTDPGWYARTLVDAAQPIVTTNDRVPAVADNEKLSGGAATIQRQFTEPFSAFAFGRLGIRMVPRFVSGLSASLRGTLIHDALSQLYSGRPTRDALRSWTDSDLSRRLAAALRASFARHESSADAVLQQLLELEKQRIDQLLRQALALDSEREDFQIVKTEAPLETMVSGVRIRLRVDRIDELRDGGVIILDYKTGKRRQFLDTDAEPREMQLVVYAMAAEEPVVGLGLFNIDSRAVGIDGAGKTFTPDLEWDESLSRWIGEVREMASEIKQGDVRINRLLSSQLARPLSLLSRIRELHRGL